MENDNRTNRKQVLLDTITHTDKGTCVAVISDKTSDLKVPVIISLEDYNKIESMMIGDNRVVKSIYGVLFNILEENYIDIVESHIYDVVDGVFLVNITTANEETDKTSLVDCSISEAMILSILFEFPIYMSIKVLKEVGINLEDEYEIADVEEGEMSEDGFNEEILLGISSVENNLTVLENLLEKAVEDQDFELAAKLRDDINRIKNKSDDPGC